MSEILSGILDKQSLEIDNDILILFMMRLMVNPPYIIEIMNETVMGTNKTTSGTIHIKIVNVH